LAAELEEEQQERAAESPRVWKAPFGIVAASADRRRLDPPWLQAIWQ
jgi:hypothetical protein